MSDSSCWKNLLKVKDIYLIGRRVTLRKGDIIRFWHDPWFQDAPLKISNPVLFDISHAQDYTFGQVLENNLVIPFRRRLTPVLLQQWDVIKDAALAVTLSDVGDEISWGLNPNGKFSTSSVYRHLEKKNSGPDNKFIWKAKLPLKIKVFLWQLSQDAVLTRENMMKRNWLGRPVCSFCSNIETASHLFFNCATTRFVWGLLGACLGTKTYPRNIWQTFVWFHKYMPNDKKFYTLMLAAFTWSIRTTRNKITFENYKMRSPEVIIYTVASFMVYWAGLYDENDAAKIKGGAKKLMEKAAEVVRGMQDGGQGQGELLLVGSES